MRFGDLFKGRGRSGVSGSTAAPRETSAPAPSSSSVRARQWGTMATVMIVLGLMLVALTLVMRSHRAAQPFRGQLGSAGSTGMPVAAAGSGLDAGSAWRSLEDARADKMSKEIKTLQDELAKKNGAASATPGAPGQSGAINPASWPQLPPAQLPPRVSLPPPPPPPTAQRANLPPLPPGAPGAHKPDQAIESSGIDSGSMSTSAASGPGAGKKGATLKTAATYLPSGSFARAIILGGIDAPTGGQAQSNPQPVLLRLVGNAQLPNFYRSHLKNCMLVGSGYGDISSERAFIRLESISCINDQGQALDMPIKGYVAGEDGKAGVRGRLVSKQGQVLANALIAGIASGMGQAFQQSNTTYSISPLGSTSTVNPGREAQLGLSTGVGKAMNMLAQYYISLADKLFPIIEVDAGREVDVVVTQGAQLPMGADDEGLTQVDNARYGERKP